MQDKSKSLVSINITKNPVSEKQSQVQVLGNKKQIVFH